MGNGTAYEDMLAMTRRVMAIVEATQPVGTNPAHPDQERIRQLAARIGASRITEVKTILTAGA